MAPREDAWTFSFMALSVSSLPGFSAALGGRFASGVSTTEELSIESDFWEVIPSAGSGFGPDFPVAGGNAFFFSARVRRSLGRLVLVGRGSLAFGGRALMASGFSVTRGSTVVSSASLGSLREEAAESLVVPVLVCVWKD